ncbi:hypothetical protein [Tenacibaculum maritimum]|uniref:hypothetical protein n=1 Tax=Tenacibaculum maritimum TaxID=107401 RepID=UPI001E5B74B3|nr:hypothetical protein [Tenacibaculum maritimum]MCD9586182.1 hypothetical protein [Tenacibaculum maritimum]MCD9622133.1 hypothetical protein [Tenacibaculum maritimum]MCD9628565.1 hypothetical protein [Tenacibaculum maritimum]MCD9631438.1 hypothetical protein [Tenacibaculum maritimum]MCD9634339.1 hypothetical protein [Tenacibaculum maritimum]
MKKRLIMLFSFLLLISCNDGVNYVSQNNGNHLIDFDLFSIVLPKDFEYDKIDGIDSFVGEIKNGKSKFIFDYGWYSPSPPKDKKAFIEESKKSLDFATTLSFCNQIDLKKYKNDKEGINLPEITNRIKNLTLHKISDSILIDNDFKDNCEFYYTLEFEEKEYKVLFCIPEEKKIQFKNYEFHIDTIGNYRRTIALWTNDKKPNISSINLEPINSDLKNKLSIGIKSNMEFEKNELKEIFKTVKIK